MIGSLACLALLAGALASGATPDAPASDAEVHVVVARRDGTHAAAKIPLAETELSQAKHFWAWTDRLPPRRFEITKPLWTRAQIVEELGRSKARPLEIRVRGWSRPEELAAVRVIVAPREMWGQVPEALLPSAGVSREGRVTVQVLDPFRIRVIAKDKGSAWQQPGSSAKAVDVALREASDAELTLRLRDGAPPPRAFATAISIRRGEAAHVLQAQFASDDRGRVRIPSLPDAEIVTLVLTAEGAAPRTISGTASELTRTASLEPGARISGTFVDEDGKPLSGVRVETEGWISQEVAALSGEQAVSDEKGRWTVSSLPRVRIVLHASSERRARLRKDVSLDEGDVDLGTVVLMPASELTLTVVDPANQPVPRALVTSDGGFKGRTRDDGTIVIEGLAADTPASLRLSAEGFASQTAVLSPPLPRRERVVLERAFTVTGRITDEAGMPISDGIAIITIGRSYRRESIAPGGDFSFDLDADQEFELTFESSSSASMTRKESAGHPGETRDLGTIRLTGGTTVRGRIVDPADAPVAGARVWAIRPHAAGAVAAWVAGRVVQAISDADGSFELRGMPAGAALLRIDAADFARSYRNVVIEDSPVDAGIIEVVRGSTVVVKSRHDDAQARLDLRGEWLDADMLSVPVVDGEARVRNVAPGQYRVTVMNGHAVVCDRRVDVKEGADARVECPGPMIVRGRVLFNGTPAYEGSLAWSQVVPVDALIDTRMSPAGARQERVYGMGGGTIMVGVRPDGTFETDQLRAGGWQVAWRSGDDSGTPAQPVNVPDVAEARVTIEFTDNVIRGRVVDARQQPVPRARIREIEGPLFAMSDPNGAFTITGVATGAHRLQAALGARASRVMDIVVEPGKSMPEVVIELDDAERNVLTVHVTGIDGTPLPNAFVFIEAPDGWRILTAGADGVARSAFPAGLRDGARLAAFANNAWAFATLRRTGGDGDPQTAAIRFTRTGSLSVRSRTATGTLVLSAQAGDLSWMLSRVGYPVAVTPGTPLVIQGLPPGSYDVALGPASVTVPVSAGATATADLP